MGTETPTETTHTEPTGSSVHKILDVDVSKTAMKTGTQTAMTPSTTMQHNGTIPMEMDTETTVLETMQTCSRTIPVNGTIQTATESEITRTNSSTTEANGTTPMATGMATIIKTHHGITSALLSGLDCFRMLQTTQTCSHLIARNGLTPTEIGLATTR